MISLGLKKNNWIQSNFDFNFLSLFFLILFVVNVALEFLDIHYPVGLLFCPVLLLANAELCQNNINWSRFILNFLPFIIISLFYILMVLFPNLGLNSIYLLVYHSLFSILLFATALYIFSSIKYWGAPIDNRKAVVIISLISNNVIISISLFIEILSVIFHFSFFENWLSITNYIPLVNVFIIIYSLILGDRKIVTEEFLYSNTQLKSNILTDNDQKMYCEILDKLFEEKKIFLRYDITLDYLSKESGIPKNKLSLYLNKYQNTSFYEKVAEYRIEYSISTIGNLNNNMNLQEIAYSSGFNSVSTFNKYFKKVTGKTVSDYIKSI